jgi:branched-chain amino acid transport system permease protein
VQFWIVQSLNSLAMDGLLFLLSAGFSLIFGLLRIPNLAHGALFMLGAYIGAALEAGLLRRLAGNEHGQVLVTLGVAFIIADLCLMTWGGDPMPLAAPRALRAPVFLARFAFPGYRVVVLGFALAMALGLWLLLERTRLGAMIRAGDSGVPAVLGGVGSLPGALVGSFINGAIYNFGSALFPDFTYVLLFLPMVIVLVIKPTGLFGRVLRRIFGISRLGRW